MKEHPLLLKSEMVRAVLEGRKTQTRCPIVPQPIFERGAWCVPAFFCNTEKGFKENLLRSAFKCPWRVGDILWVRETWTQLIIPDGMEYKRETVYKATDWKGWLEYEIEPIKWRPSIHMPRWTSRITPEITDIRVERIRDITIPNIYAEGIVGHKRRIFINFEQLWDSIYVKKGYGWSENPWVWVREFKGID